MPPRPHPHFPGKNQEAAAALAARGVRVGVVRLATTVQGRGDPGFMALLANLAMLSGLLGTVSGLISSFGAVSGESVDPSQKARILAEGISEAMHCTFFGLTVAIMALLGFAVLNGKTQQLEDDINEASVQVLNLILNNRQKVNMAGVAA